MRHGRGVLVAALALTQDEREPARGSWSATVRVQQAVVRAGPRPGAHQPDNIAPDGRVEPPCPLRTAPAEQARDIARVAFEPNAAHAANRVGGLREVSGALFIFPYTDANVSHVQAGRF